MPGPVFRPREVGIELVRGGNFSCVMGPVTSNADKEPEKFQFLDLGLLGELVGEMDRWPSIERIWFFHFGEPMAHPKYRECLEILADSATATKAEVIQHTNASLLYGAKAQAILDVPIITKLVFSFDGFGDKNRFEAMRGPHFDRVLANIRAFSEEARRRRPDLQLATCSILPKPGELPLADGPPSRDEAVGRLHELFDPLGVAVEVRDLHDDIGSDELTLAGRGPAQVFGGCPFVEKDSLYFTVKGWAQPCGAVHDESFNVGKFDAEAGFGELLNGPEMNRVRHALRMDRRHEVPHCSSCKFSLGGLLPEPELRKWWEDRDDAGLVLEPDERHRLFGTVVPTEHRVVRVELGCGFTKSPGFVGVDRFPLPGVDIVGDLDKPLPIESDSVDLVYASHSLEHVANIQKTMAEVYRICKHGAQICIVAPYHMQKLNLANPYHKQVFNEHTPRFWTASPVTGIDPAEYAHPNSPDWGLLLSDNRDDSMDIRCVRMEFFYFPEYEKLPQAQQRRARSSGVDVCDQIVYHMMVVKEPITQQEFRAMSQRMHYYEPAYVEVRRLRLEAERLRAENAKLAEEQVAHSFPRFQAQTTQRLIEELSAADSRAEALAAELDQIRRGTGWRIVTSLSHGRHRYFPAGSRREKFGKLMMRFQRKVRRSLAQRPAG